LALAGQKLNRIGRDVSPWGYLLSPSGRLDSVLPNWNRSRRDLSEPSHRRQLQIAISELLS